MTRLDWDRVERERRATKGVPEEDEAKQLVTPPSSPFRSGGRKSLEPERAAPGKRAKKGRKRGKATTPFDRYTLSGTGKVLKKKQARRKKKRKRP
jgi:hypothetical protein